MYLQVRLTNLHFVVVYHCSFSRVSSLITTKHLKTKNRLLIISDSSAGVREGGRGGEERGERGERGGGGGGVGGGGRG